MMKRRLGSQYMSIMIIVAIAEELLRTSHNVDLIPIQISIYI